jgi:hypothetical protein
VNRPHPAFLHLLIRDAGGELQQWFYLGCIVSADRRRAEPEFKNLDIPITAFDLPDTLPETILPDARILVRATLLVSTEEGQRPVFRFDERWPTTVESLGRPEAARLLQHLGGSFPIVGAST